MKGDIILVFLWLFLIYRSATCKDGCINAYSNWLFWKYKKRPSEHPFYRTVDFRNSFKNES